VIGHVLLIAALIGTAAARAAEPFDPFTIADIEDRLGASVPEDLGLRDETGRRVRLGDYLAGRPLLFAPVDFGCQNICGITLGGLFGALDDLGRRPGAAFELLVVSIDRNDRPADGAAALSEYRDRFETAAGAHFLTGDAAPLLAATGFRYAYDPKTELYAHPAAVAVVTPNGRLARWLYGYPFEPFDLRLALTDAGGEKVGGLTDRLWQLCFRYDPKIGAYTPAILRALKAGGALTVLLVGGGIALALCRERGRKR
jgi:protein SCO1